MVRRAFGSAFSDDELEDIYSGAWLSTLSALDRKPERLEDDELRRYVMTAVANQASREMRRRGRKPTVSLEVAGEAMGADSEPDEAAARAESSSVARDVLASLPARRRAVMVFRYGWGLEPSEICGLVDGLSRRAYRKEIERGVAEVARKMRLVEGGDWCESREPLLRAVAAGEADEDQRRQVRHHLAHCKRCAGFAGGLSRNLHDLGGSVSLAGVAGSFMSGDGNLVERGASLVDRGKHAVGSLFGKGSEAAEQAALNVSASGGARGVGAAGAGALAKLAGIGALPKVVAACLGTTAAATACVAAGVVPGVLDEPRRESERTSSERTVERERSDALRHAALPAVLDPEPSPVADGEGVPPSPAAEDPVPSPPDQQPAETPTAPPEPPPTVQEFEPVGTPTSGPAASTGGGGTREPGGSTQGGDFGP